MNALLASFGVVGRPPFCEPINQQMCEMIRVVVVSVLVGLLCVFPDCAPIEIEDNLQMGPAVQIYTAAHPLDADVRQSGLEYARPIRIGHDVWIGGGAIILPGVTIGDRSVIGAGSVVVRDVPAATVVVGNPARILRALDDRNDMEV